MTTHAAAPSLAGAAWLREGPVGRLLELLDRDGEEARVIGGAVRNALIGLPPGDIDIATTAKPDEVMRRAAAAGIKTVPTGIEHGTVMLVLDSVGYEVTTLREDIETDGRHAVVRFGRDWTADALRRDFTMNALSANRDGRVFDPVGGLEDLRARRFRFIGNPAMRIREDYLRILRFFRFHAGYGAGALDAEGLSACLRERDGLARLSRERVRVELLKLVVAPGAVETLNTMAEAGLAQAVLGTVPRLGAFARLAAIERTQNAPADAVRRLAALAVEIEEDAERLRERLRLANEEARRLSVIAAPARRLARGAAADGDKALLYRLGAADFADVVLLAWARSGAAADDAEWAGRLALPQRWTAPRFPLAARDLIARGLKPGPALGAALAHAEAAWIEAGFPMAPDALKKIARAAVAAVR